MFKTILFLILIVVLSAQQNRLTVRSIVVVGNDRTDASTIRINSGLFIGKEISATDIQTAIRNLWEIRQWKQIKIESSDIAENGEIDIVIRVEEYPRLAKFEFIGNDELDNDDLDKVSRFFNGMIVTPYKMYKAKLDIKSKYEKEGYLLAEVTIDTLNLPENKIGLKITIKEGSEIQVEKITVHGLVNLENGDITGAMKETSTNGFLGFGGTYNGKKYKEDLTLITKYIQNQGYRNGALIRDSISYSEDKEDMYIDLYVYEGDQYFFGNLNFQGNKIFTNDDFLENVNLEKGEPYNEDKFTEVASKLKQLYYDKGYLFAQISPSEVLTLPDTVNINYNITERKVVKINEIYIEGNTKTQEKVIRREMKIYPGNKFSQTKIQRTMSDLQVLNYFENIVPDVKPLQPESDEKVNLLFVVKEKSTDQANASIGYSELDGLIGSIGLSFNNFSLTNPFREGGGQVLAINAQFGSFQDVYSVSVTEPWLNNTPTLLGGSIYYSNTNKDNANNSYRSAYVPYNEDRFSVSLTLGRKLNWPDNYFRASLGAQVTRSTISNVDESIKQNYPYFRNAEGKTLYSTSFTSNISRDARNSAEFPTDGSLYTVSSDYNFGDKNYLKNIFQAQTFTPIFGKVIFYSNVKVGTISRYGNNDLLLPNDLFHMGGSGLSYASESLRGYTERTVGADGVIVPSGSTNSESGNVSLGGDALFKMTQELRIQVVPNPTIFILAFLEAGNVWKNPSSMDITNLSRSAGVGIRMFMPLVGIIGFDLGYGFDRFENIFSAAKTPKWEFHFQFGKF